MNLFGGPQGERVPAAGAPVAPQEAAPMLSVQAALMEVNGIMAMVMAMGNNDYELSSLQGIIAKLQNNKYDNPSTAVAEARGIMDNKLIR